jgi:hypothetical protein
VVTAFVATAKLVDDEPAGTTTLAGTTTALLELVTVTAAPPLGAVPDNVIVAVDCAPPTTLGGLSVNPVSFGGAAGGAGGVTVKIVVFTLPPYEAVSVADVNAPTAAVAMPNVALLDPCCTVVSGGTTIALLAVDSATFTPPGGATDVSDTVPTADAPPTTELGLALIEASAAVAGTGCHPSAITSKSLAESSEESGVEHAVVPPRVERPGDVHVRAVVGDDESVALHRAEDLLHVGIARSQRGVLSVHARLQSQARAHRQRAGSRARAVRRRVNVSVGCADGHAERVPRCR